ncbi:MAG TPA: UDP-glucose 4-epimerase GalE [Acidimicrobiia bacterium]|jgi:UDP-glucose 4-epimerase|nr:UDP-glucose 4-epimerase GalE [Acidimicrobiia bacterium]
MRVLVTGGAGFIGSHTVVELMAAGHEAVVVDNLSNSQASVIRRIGELTGSAPEFHETDVRNQDLLAELASSGFDACIHFAALKAVGESVEQPLLYYDNNVAGTIALLEVLVDAGVENFVFSSSATVYGDPVTLPLREDMPIGEATNPYGWSKIMMEQVLKDVAAANPEWSVTLLRYFNPVGAHTTGLIGEDPRGIPNNLMPYVAKVAAGQLPKLKVFGGDYPTPDGTGIRDYIHVVDLAKGHVAALEHTARRPGVHIYNLGTGNGHSVLEVVKTYEEESGRPIPYEIVGRRAGDVAASWADVEKAARELGWRTTMDLADMCRDSWLWQRNAR